MLTAPVKVQTEIERWLSQLGQRPESLEPLVGDVSARRYFRVRAADGSRIVAVYPPALRDACERFAATSRLLGQAGLRVPAVLASDCHLGVMLLEDLGDRTLYDLRREDWTVLRPHLEQGIEDAARITRLDREVVAKLNPPLDEALLARELEQTWRSYLIPRGLTGGSRTTAALRDSLGELCRRLAAEPPVPCHRDFMARNLVPMAEGRLAVLDHQDLRLGPPFYDLASLLNDSLYPPAELVAELLGPTSDERPYHRAAAQRTLKIIGTFAVFAERGEPRHLVLVPPTIERAVAHLRRLPETAEIIGRLAERWLAVC